MIHTDPILLFFDNLWLPGLLIVLACWIYGINKGKPYTEGGLWGYVCGFGAITWNMFAVGPFEVDWINWGIGGLSGMLAFGAFLEYKKAGKLD